ncbi:Uncharacterised protein [Vibrio cholerae]|nr:Uncharacterised protein [Vibrio cholerae]CSD56051.1 Uncharacterised protein [Vibrio cholerae]CSI62239.1 Uncharacterised protein [Vibrio cholerae]
MAFEPSPRRAFFISTKLPTCASSRSSAPGRRRVNGPTVQFSPTVAPSITLYGRITVLSSISQSLRIEPAPITTLLPIDTLPSIITLTSISTSEPHCSVPRRSKRAGSRSITPCSSSFLA